MSYDDMAAALTEDLIRDEGLRLKPYRCTAGKLTIGIGRNLEDRGISQMEARWLLKNDIDQVHADIDRALPWWKGLSEPRQRALMNMAFNLGVAGLMGFKGMLGHLQAGEYQKAAAAALGSRWADQVGSRAHRIAKLLENG